jgi:hypothetical protein
VKKPRQKAESKAERREESDFSLGGNITFS